MISKSASIHPSNLSFLYIYHLYQLSLCIYYLYLLYLCYLYCLYLCLSLCNLEMQIGFLANEKNYCILCLIKLPKAIWYLECYGYKIILEKHRKSTVVSSTTWDGVSAVDSAHPNNYHWQSSLTFRVMKVQSHVSFCHSSRKKRTDYLDETFFHSKCTKNLPWEIGNDRFLQDFSVVFDTVNLTTFLYFLGNESGRCHAWVVPIPEPAV